MHENRETSLPTVSASGSPAGEGESRTSGTHGREESDRAVLPMKPANKVTGQSPGAAEMVEGRVRTEENVEKARAVPAQDGAAATQGLKGVRKAARERKQERFTTWLHHLTVDLLRDSFHALKRDAAPGVEGVRWAGSGVRAPRRGRAVPEGVWGTAGEVRAGTASGEDAVDRVRTKRRTGTRGGRKS